MPRRSPSGDLRAPGAGMPSPLIAEIPCWRVLESSLKNSCMPCKGPEGTNRPYWPWPASPWISLHSPSPGAPFQFSSGPPSLPEPCCRRAGISFPFSGLVYWMDLGVAFLLDALLGHTLQTISTAICRRSSPWPYCTAFCLGLLWVPGGWRKYKVFLNNFLLILKCLKGLRHHHQRSVCRWWWRSKVLWCGVRCEPTHMELVSWKQLGASFDDPVKIPPNLMKSQMFIKLQHAQCKGLAKFSSQSLGEINCSLKIFLMCFFLCCVSVSSHLFSTIYT